MKIKKILVIRFRRVGDAVLGVSICSSLRKSFPDAQIDYVLNKSIAPLFDHHPDIDNIITFSASENDSFFRYISKVWKVMRKNRYDVIIDTRSTVRTLVFSLFSPWTAFRIGTKKRYNYLLNNYRIDNHCDDKKDMIEDNLLMLKPLEKIADVKYVSEFRLYVTNSEKESFRSYMEQKGIDFSCPVVLATVTARLIHKVWDKKKMQEVLSRMIEKYDTQIIFNFDRNEKAFATALHKEMKFDRHIFTNIEARSLRELCALTSNCDFFFGNEGGPRHISQALGIPSYAIFPPGILKSIWLPSEGKKFQGISVEEMYSRDYLKDLNYHERFDLLEVDDVWDGLDKMLEEYFEMQNAC